jgi:hypothetical protein
MNKLGIRSQLKALLNRNDITDAIADTFIDQAVARIQRTLRVPAMEKQIIYTATDVSPELLVLPNDFLQARDVYTDNGTLTFKDLNSFQRYPLAVGTPIYYTRIQGAYKVKPTPRVDFKIYMTYYGEIPDLVSDTDENFLTAIAPDLLVYGALTFAADYYVDDRKQAFEDSFNRIYGEVMDQAYQMEMTQDGAAIAPAYTYPEY